jgi:hypothetical protein
VAGYVFTSPREVESAIRHTSLYVAIGLCFAETAGQKQFIFECIARELGMSIADLRTMSFPAKPGEPFDIQEFVDEFDKREKERGQGE